MLTWMQATTDLLWRNALVLVPMAACVLILCRFIPNRPAIRHSLWLCLVVWLVAGTVLPPLRLSPTRAAAIRNADDQTPVRIADDEEFLEAAAAVDLDTLPESPPPTLFEVERATPIARRLTSAEPRRQAPHDIIRDILPNESTIRLADAMPRKTTPTPPRTVAPVASDSPSISLPASAGVGRLSNQQQTYDAAQEPRTLMATTLQKHAQQPLNDPLPPFFPLPLDVALGMHRAAGGPPRFFYDPSVFQDSLKQGSAFFPHREADAQFNSPTLLLADLRSKAQQWAAAMIGIRDAVGRLPAIPLWFWFAGVLLVVTIRARLLIVFRRHISAAAPANVSIRRLVDEVSRDIGLRRPPRTVMTQAHISPMIWCGRITTLVLPRSLWRDLDDTGRRAILYHELAHVRRRDHIVCWIEWIVGALYWWHPLVWWVRSRLSEEAENCCDAWVTWLMPRERRAYAEALLRTKQFADDSVPVKPAVGIGILTGRAKRFARRLTMVMTQKTAPTGSARSIALIACVSLIGWLATPALSLDEKPKKSDKTPTAAAACSGAAVTTDATPCKQKNVTKCSEACVGTKNSPCPVVVVDTSDSVRLEAGTICVESSKAPSVVVGASGKGHMTPLSGYARPAVIRAVPAATAVPALPAIAALPAMGDDDGDLAERMERLERHMEVLAEKLERLNNWQAVPPMAQEHFEAYGEAIEDYASAMPNVAFLRSGGEKEVVRTYVVPEGRREALTELMVRDDVPVRVRPVDGGIEVHGPESVQAHFKAFVEIITSNESLVVEYVLPKGQLDALQALMVRSDVPVIVSPGEGKIAVHGNAATQAVFRNFVEMLDGGAVPGISAQKAKSRGAGRASRDSARSHGERAERERARAERQAQSQQRRDAAQQRRQAYRERSKAMEQAIKEMVLHSEQIEREIDRLEREADQVQRKAEEMRKKAEQLRKKLRRSNGAEAEQLEARADEAEAKADALMAHADSIRDKADQLEDKATAIEDEVEAMEDELEDMEEEPEPFDA